MAKNAWLLHLKKIRAENPKIKDVKTIAKLAKKTYVPAAKKK
jgi:hypothetical protein